MTKKEQYQARKKSGLCVKCGKVPPAEGKAMCEECARKCREYTNQNRAFYRKVGICPYCGKHKLFGEEKMCPECQAKKAMWPSAKIVYPHKHSDITTERRKREGICIRCGKNKAEPGKTRCRRCNVLAAEAERIRRGNYMRRYERPLYALCYFCGEPVKPGYKVCEKHYEIIVKARYRRNDTKLYNNDRCL